MRIPTATARTRSMRVLVLPHRALVSGQRLCRPGMGDPMRLRSRTRRPVGHEARLSVRYVLCRPGVPLTKVPSLHPLRRRSLGLVRGLPWHYARMCDFSRPALSATALCLPGTDHTALACGRARDLPVPAHRASAHARVSDRAGSSGGSRSRRPPSYLPLSRRRRHPEQTLAADLCVSPVNASPRARGSPAHDSGSAWTATPSLQWTFTTYSLPLYRRTETALAMISLPLS
jgi:hypothetical protein